METGEGNLGALRRAFGVDLRSLAAFRIGLGLVILADLLGRAPFLAVHYGDGGLLPRDALTHPTLHALSGSPAYAGFLFAVAGVFALMLVLGYRTFLATAASWALLVSLHHRNPLVIDSGDKLLALLLFWGMFLPLGARASVDSRAASDRRRPPEVYLGAASVALLLQLAFVYMFSALLKSKELWFVEGSAIGYALHVDTITTGFGRWLLGFPALLALASRGTLALELLAPLLLFLPVGTARARTVLAAVFAALHLLMAASFELVIFPYVCVAAWTAVLPGTFWESLGKGRLASAVTGRVSALAGRLPARPRGAFHLGGLRWSGAAVVALLSFVLYWNLTTVYRSLGMPRPLERAGEALCLRQRWAMFGRPPTDDGWWVVPAELADGTGVDLFTGRSPVDWRKPELVSATFPTGRLRKLLRHARGDEQGAMLERYAEWLRADWSSRHGPGRRVVAMEISWMLEETLPDLTTAPLERVPLYEWRAPDAPAP